MQSKLLYGAGGLILGAALGFFAANSLNRQVATLPTGGSTVQVPEDAAPASAQSIGMQGDVTQTLQKAENEPTNFAAQMKAGDMYARIGRFDKAVEFYSKGVSLNPQNVQAQIVIANAYFDSMKFEEAEKHYAKALDLDPKNVNARTDFGATFVERTSPDYERGIAEFRKALELDPKNAPALYYYGVAQLRKGDRGGAEKTLAELENTNPQSDLVARLRQNLDAKQSTQ